MSESAPLKIMDKAKEKLLDEKIKEELSRLHRLEYVSLMDLMLSGEEIEAQNQRGCIGDFFCDEENVRDCKKWLSKKHRARKNFYFTNCIRKQPPGMFAQGGGVYHLCEAFALLSGDGSIVIYYRTIKKY